jgi:hypothetical protein
MRIENPYWGMEKHLLQQCTHLLKWSNQATASLQANEWQCLVVGHRSLLLVFQVKELDRPCPWGHCPFTILQEWQKLLNVHLQFKAPGVLVIVCSLYACGKVFTVTCCEIDWLQLDRLEAAHWCQRATSVTSYTEHTPSLQFFSNFTNSKFRALTVKLKYLGYFQIWPKWWFFQGFRKPLCQAVHEGFISLSLSDKSIILCFYAFDCLQKYAGSFRVFRRF